MEHRWGHREEVMIPVRLRWRQHRAAARGRITNISTSGAWIGTAAAVPALTPIEIEMALGNTTPAVAGHVVRRGQGGVGVEWREPLLPVAVIAAGIYGMGGPHSRKLYTRTVP